MTPAISITSATRPNPGTHPDIGPVVVSSMTDMHNLARIGVDAVYAKGGNDPILADMDSFSIWPTQTDQLWLASFESAIANTTAIDAAAPSEWLTRNRTAADVEILLHTWPPLHSLEAPKLPRLPERQLPSWAGEYAVALTNAFETPPELAFACVLGACSIAIARRVQVRVTADYVEPCNLWLMCALPPANRKSPIISKTFGPLRQWESTQRGSMKMDIIARKSEINNQEARAEKLRKQAAACSDEMQRGDISEQIIELEQSIPEQLKPPTLWTSDSTPEKLGSLLADDADECIGWVSSEGGLFEILGGRYSSGAPNLDIVLQAWSQDPVRINRGQRTDDVQAPTLTICLSPQPDVLKGLANKKGFSGRGLLGRFLVLLPPSPIGYRQHNNVPIPPFIADEYSTRLNSMLDWPRPEQGRYTLTMSTGAHEERRIFQAAIEKMMRPSGPLHHMQDWAGKCVGQTVRLAGVLHCVELANTEPWSTPIERESMIAATDIMDVFLKHAIATYQLMAGDADHSAALKFWQWICNGKREKFNLRDAQQNLKNSLGSTAKIRLAAEDLAERGYIQIIEQLASTGRAPSPICRVRPDLAARWQR